MENVYCNNWNLRSLPTEGIFREIFHARAVGGTGCCAPLFFGRGWPVDDL